MQKIKRKELLKNLLLLASSLVLSFIFAEITLRFTWQSPGYGYPEGLHISDDTKGYKYQPNFVGNFPTHSYSNIEIRINSKGLRDYEHSYEKTKSKLRILGLGDSITFGAGVEYEDTYLRQLENKFSHNGYNVEIIKAGVNGYEFDQQYTGFFEEGYKYKPDIVIIGIALNDAQPVNVNEITKSYSLENNSLSSKAKSAIGKYCVSCKFAYYSLADIYQKISSNGEDYNQLYFERVYDLWRGGNWEIYKSKLLHFNSYLNDEGIELVLVIFPYTQQFEKSLGYGREPQNKIINLANSNDIEVIDLTPYLDVQDFKQYYLAYDNVHLNAEGHNIVKEVLYSELINRKLVTNNVKQ